jgi:hypothetical protein
MFLPAPFVRDVHPWPDFFRGQYLRVPSCESLVNLPEVIAVASNRFSIAERDAVARALVLNR